MSFFYERIFMTAGCLIFASTVLYLLEKKTGIASWKYWQRQGLYGVVFTILAIGAGFWGIGSGGMTDNIQDAAPLCAGLIFGAPAGLLSGGISGGVLLLYGFQKVDPIWMTAAVSLLIAGALAAILRRYMFDDRKASCWYGFMVGLVVAVFHILILILTHLHVPYYIYRAVQLLTPPLLLGSSLSVMVSLAIVSYIGRESQKDERDNRRELAQTFQLGLLICVVVSFLVTCIYSWVVQTKLAQIDAENLLSLNLKGMCQDIRDVSDQRLISVAKQAAKQLTPEYYRNDHPGQAFYNAKMEALLKIYGLSEASLMDKRGIIVSSTNPKSYGYDMAKGKQSAEFLTLLQGTETFAQQYQPLSSDPSLSRKYVGIALPGRGIFQIGYDAELLQRSIDAELVDYTMNLYIGKMGGIMICDAKGNIVSDNSSHQKKSLSAKKLPEELLKQVRQAKTYQTLELMLHGQQSLCMYDQVEGYYVITYIPDSEVMFSRDIGGYITIFMEIILFAIIFLVIYFLVKKLVVDNIHKVNHALAEITGGNLNVKVDVHTNAEFASLSDDINSTVEVLKGYIAEAADRLNKELEFARNIQLSALPTVFPDRPEFLLHAYMDTAREVGGDFYDFYCLGDNRVVLLMADVSGKGIPAALFMMKAKTLIKGLVEEGRPLAEIFARANNKLCENNEAGMFVTTWMGILDVSSGRLDFVNAGHTHPLLSRKEDQTAAYVPMKNALFLGGMEDVPYTTETLQMQPGDMIFLYTDGLTEAIDEQGGFFGAEQLKNVFSQHQEKEPMELIAEIRKKVAGFVGKAEQSDDITMLALRYRGKNGEEVKR